MLVLGRASGIGLLKINTFRYVVRSVSELGTEFLSIVKEPAILKSLWYLVPMTVISLVIVVDNKKD